MSRVHIVALTTLTLIGGWLRFSSTTFGLPDKFRPDEQFIISPTGGFRRDWNPHFASYPAGHMYLQHAVLRAYARVVGHTNDFRSYYAADDQVLAHVVARRTTSAFGTATIPAIYLAASSSFGPNGALAAAAILTFSTLHVRESKYASTDVPAAFWVTLAIGLLLRVVRRGRYRDSLATGVACGLAVATKYPAGAVLFSAGVAHLEARWREGRSLRGCFADPRIYLTAFAALAVFLSATPYLVLDWEQTVKSYTYQKLEVVEGVGNPLTSWGWSWLLLRMMPDSFGITLSVLFLLGFVWGLLRPRLGTLSLVVFLAVAFAAMAGSRNTFYRYLVIPLPALALLAGRLVGDLADAVAAWGRRPYARVAVAAGLAVLLLPSAVRDVQLNRILSRRDTRTLAREWIEQNVPPGALIAASDHLTPHGKPRLRDAYRYVALEQVGALRAKSVHFALDDSSPLAFYSEGASPDALADLEKHATLVFDVDPIEADAAPPVFDMADAFYAPLQHISSMRRPGPRIRIWRVE